jgi:hypothetical protein
MDAAGGRRVVTEYSIRNPRSVLFEETWMRALLCLAFGAITPIIALAQDATELPVPGNPPSATNSPQNPLSPYQTKPTEPRGFPNASPRQGPLPAPKPPGDQDRQVRILEAGNIERRGNTIRLTGGAKIQYRGYDIIGQEIVGDLTTEIFEATGSVHVQGQDAEVTGERVRVSYRDRTYRAWNTVSQLQPSLFEAGLEAPLYVTAKESFGSQRELFANDSVSTTCDLPDPHFTLEADSTIVRPNTRAIFRGLKLSVLDHTILKIPYLSVPLNQPSYRYIPEFGRTQQDGYYMKSRYGIPLDNPQNNLDARFDYFQKRGQAFGGDYRYGAQGLAGLLTVYTLLGASKTLNVNSQHQQKFSWGSLSLDSSYQKNNFDFAPESTLLSNRLQMIFPQGASSSRFSFFQTDNTSSGFSSKSQTVSIGDTRSFSPALRTNLDVSMVSNDSGSIKQDRVNVNLTGDNDLKKAIAHFQYQRAIPIGDNQNFFNASDVTPLLSLTSDNRRLLGSKAPKSLPFTTSLSFGNFIDGATRDKISRGAFDFAFQRPDTSQKRAKLSLNGKFAQGVYSDDTAQYTLTFDSVASYRLGGDTGLNLRYNYRRPYGFSPLAMDQSGKTNLISGDLSFRPFRPFLIGIQSGYDLEALRLGTRTPYQFVGVRTEYTPASWLNVRTLSTYDPFQQLWSNHRVDFAYRPGATFVSVGAQYDGQRQTWGSANIFVDNLKWGRLSVSALLQYNGYTKQFLTKHYSVAYDLHCAEAVLQILENNSGFNPGRQVLFFLRVKALPFESPFGVGSFGQALGTGGGVRF